MDCKRQYRNSSGSLGFAYQFKIDMVDNLDEPNEYTGHYCSVLENFTVAQVSSAYESFAGGCLLMQHNHAMHTPSREVGRIEVENLSRVPGDA